MRSCLIFCSVVLLLAGVALVAYPWEVWGQSAEVLKKYENPNFGLRFSYPSYWGILEEDEECNESAACGVTSSVQGEGDQINDFVVRVSAMRSDYWEIKESCKCDNLIEYVQYSYKEAVRVYTDGFKFINDSQTLVGNKYPAWRIEFSAKLDPESESQIHTEVLSTNNNTFYKIAYVPFSNNSLARQIPEFNKIIESIEFFPVNKTVPKTPSFLNSSIPIPTKGTEPTLASLSGLEILSHNSFTDSIGYLHVVGEVQNNGPTNLQFVKVTSTFYDSNNQVVATDFTYTNPTDIGPRQKAPFELILSSASIPITQIDHYNLVASYQ